MYFDISLHLVAQALLRVSHEYRVTGNGRYLASGFNYQGNHRIFILQLDIIGLPWEKIKNPQKIMDILIVFVYWLNY